MTPERAAQILHLKRPWTTMRIKKAYRSRAQVTHPDKGGTDNAFNSVREAYELLVESLDSTRPRRRVRPTRSYTNSSWSTPNDTEDDPVDVEEEPEVESGDWMHLRGLKVDAVAYDPTGCRCQLEVKEHVEKGWVIVQAILAIYLKTPIGKSAARVEVVIADASDPDGSGYVCKVTGRSYNKQGNIRTLWVELAVSRTKYVEPEPDYSYHGGYYGGYYGGRQY